jgi:hypothetical protein
MMEIAGEEHQQWQGVRLAFGAPVGVLHQQAQSRPPLLVFFTNRLNSPQSFAESKTKQTENLTI